MRCSVFKGPGLPPEHDGGACLARHYGKGSVSWACHYPRLMRTCCTCCWTVLRMVQCVWTSYRLLRHVVQKLH